MALSSSDLSASIQSKLLAAFPDATDSHTKIITTWSDAIAQAVVEHITTQAELTIPQYTIPAGAVSTGTGAAAVPSPAPIPIVQPPTPPGAVK